jgi:hypothetical protein
MQLTTYSHRRGLMIYSRAHNAMDTLLDPQACHPQSSCSKIKLKIEEQSINKQNDKENKGITYTSNVEVVQNTLIPTQMQ